MTRFFFFLFFLIAALVLAADVADLVILHQLTKPLIMISLLGYYLSSVPPGTRSFALVLALIFSWAGDVLLMFSGQLYFMLGLGGFLISHVFYVLTYRQHKAEKGEGFLGVQKARYAFPVILAGTGLLTVLYPTLGGMKVPVTAYALVLVVMVLAALFRFGFTGSKSFWMVFIGAVLFMVSDSTLAINKFLQPFPSSGLLIMSTYMASQFLIVEGLIRHREN